MEKSKEELYAELAALKQKHSELEAKFAESESSFKSKEEELRIQMMFYEGIANSTFDGFLVVNPFGQKILQNQRTIELWKIPKEVVEDPDGMKQVHHVMHMTVNPQQFFSEIEYLQTHPDEKSLDELELIDGTVLDRYSSPVIGTDGKNYGRIWTFHDVTERKKLEKQLIQLNSDKDRFISILAHDLRSPFNSLLGFSELLRKKLRTYSIDKIEKMVEMINDTARKTYELLEDTLLWASIQTNKTTFNPVKTNVKEKISEVIELLEPIAKAKSITIKNAANNETIVNSDSYMLKAILRNLISNSIKFTREGGNIEISTEHSNAETIIKVIDNGIGIEPKIMEKLFSTIQSSKGTANETGTGLGLLLCKEFVDNHGGKIMLNSTLDSGTTVSFTIPDQV